MITIKPMEFDDILTLSQRKGLFAFDNEGAYFQTCYDLQQSGARIVFIAKDAGDIPQGYVILNFAPRYSLFQKLKIPEIQDLNVHPDSRNQGIGRALVELCEDIIRERGDVNQIGISVGLHKGFGAAQRLYAKLGYIPDGNGVTYDRNPVSPHEMRTIDDDLCLMMVKSL